MKQIVLATACSAALLGAGVVQSREFLSTPAQGAAVPSAMPTVTATGVANDRIAWASPANAGWRWHGSSGGSSGGWGGSSGGSWGGSSGGYGSSGGGYGSSGGGWGSSGMDRLTAAGWDASSLTSRRSPGRRTTSW